MRTIKFRGLRSDGKGWVYGDLNQNDIHHGVSILTNGVINNSVIPETVGQFTGLHDKNGKEVFESDVLNFGNNNPVEVKFENGAFTVFSEPLGWDFDIEDIPILTDFKYCEIIGNIFENPDLVKL